MEWVILSGKGGTGKTTVASALIELTKVSYYADCDVDAPNLHLTTTVTSQPKTSVFYGMKKARINQDLCIHCGACFDHCRYHAIHKENDTYTIEPTLCEGCGVCEYVCPAGAIDMINYDGGTLILYDDDKRFSTAKLKMGSHHSGLLVSSVKQALYEKEKPVFSIIDGSPGIGCPVQASMVGASLAILVTEPTLSAIADLTRLIRTIENYHLEMAVIINKATISQENVEMIEAICQEHHIFMAGKIPYDPTVIQAVNQMKSVIYYDSPAADALKQIHQTLINHYLKS